MKAVTRRILYSTGCPNCKIIKDLLDESGLEYEVCTDVDLMLGKGMIHVPMLEVYIEKDGEPLTLQAFEFEAAIQYIKERTI